MKSDISKIGSKQWAVSLMLCGIKMVNRRNPETVFTIKEDRIVNNNGLCFWISEWLSYAPKDGWEEYMVSTELVERLNEMKELVTPKPTVEV